MRRLELLSFLLLATLAVAQNDFARGDIVTSGLQRDADGVTTVLLVPAPLGKPAPPVGVLTKTARTFVQDGASTEYATQVVGTTLDNGRLYAKILSTSSRVFYDKDTPADPISPFVVYPSATSQDNTKFVLDDVPLKIVESIASKTSSSNDAQEKSTTPREDDNDILSAEVVFKPAKVRSDNLLTYTVKQDYVMKGQNAAVPAVQEDEQPKSFQPRTPKSFRPVPKSAPKKDVKPLATVTYHGFADFVTTVGDTVIVFSPSTAPAPVGRPATTIKGDATLRPDDGVAVLKIKPTSVLLSPKKTETLPSRPRLPVNKFSHKNLKSSSSSSIHDLEPSTVAHPEAESSGVYTSPLLLLPSEKSVTGLIKVIDSTTANKGTTTHYMSSVYGTYINNNYAQIVHTSSNVFFFPEDSTGIYEQDDNESNDVRNDTIESVITTEPTTESELGNDIIPLNQGRSIKGSSPKNIFPDLKGQRNKNKEEKVSLATRLLPSTIYKTFTYFTTFFIPGKGRTSTSIKSREVVSSEVTYLTELILPSNTKLASITPTKLSTSMTNKVAVSSNTDIIDSEKQDVEEIQLIFKTIFTTFTYLTTFYDDSTTSVSSRKVTATNVITQTVDPISASVDVDRLIEKDASVLIKPTKIAEVGSTHSKTRAIESKGLYENRLVTTTEETTESITTVEPEQLTTVEDQTTPETTTEKLKAKVDSVIALEPSPTPSATAKLVSEQLKTYYTTYTYFTTVFVDDETEVETRTEVFSNVVTETIKPTSVLPAIVEKTMVATTPKSSPPPEILAYLEALKKQKSSQEALKLAKKVQERTHITTEETIETTTDDSSITTDMDETTIADDVTTEKISNDGEVPESTKTDVIFTSSSGGSTLLEDKKSSDPEDQELSETNHHDVEPAPTLLLQTSYTTYTYFTTMYNGDNTDVVSRLKTVTNVVTETIKPTAVVQPESKTAQPLTYFTTFTYWTTFIKGDETATTSREETVSNVVTPGVADTSSVQLEVVKTYRPFILATPVHSSSIEPSRESKATSDNEITTSPKVIIKEIPTIKVNELSSTISPDLVTLYTTYTYFTTSYIGNSTVLNSRLETVTSISYPDDLLVKATPRAIGGGAPSQILSTDEKSSIIPSQVSETPKTGLLSTVRSSQVNDGTTTHYITDVYGTYIDGLYAQVVETSSKIELPTPVYSSSATPVLPTGVLYLNEGSIVDADELTTVYFTTKQIGTSLNGLYAKVIESTSTTKIDDKKLQTFTPVKGHRTGLVRLIKGHVDANDTITYYQSKVIGTSIDGRYAQIIESTSSYLVKPTVAQDISPSSTIPLNHATAIPDMAPSPAVIQSSISEDHTETNDEDQENENEDESDDKLKKKSRLTFSTRKRPSSAPPIRPFISRSRPTFNPKRKPQGATTITRSDFTPTITATLAGSKGSRFASSRGRATPSLGSSLINPSSSRRFSGGRRSSIPATSSASNYIAQSSRSRGGVKATPSSAYSGRRSSTPLRGSSARSISRSSVLPISSTRYRPGIRPSSTILKPSSTIKHEDQEDNANEYTAATLATEETPVAQEEDEQLETVAPVAQTTTESSRRANNPLLRFKRPPGFGSGVRTTTPRPTTLTTARRVNAGRQLNRGNNNRVRPTVSTLTTRGRQSQSSLFPPRAPFGKKPETTEASVENQTENPEQMEGNLEDAPVEEINDNDYEGSEQKEAAPPSTEKPIPQPSIRPFTRIGRGAFYRDTSGTSAIIEGAQTFGDRSPESEYYDTDEDDYTSRKRVRVRVPVIRGRTAKDHTLTVVRRRPLVPYTKSLLYQPIESSLSSLTPRKIVVTRTKIRNYDSIDAGYHLGDEISNDLYSKNNRHKVTVTRRRKVRPSSTTVAPTQRERVTRVTRKKLVTIRPIPKPSATLAIITTGFYTAPSFEVEEEDEESFDYDYSPISTPVLHGSYITRNDPIPSFTTATNKLISSRTRSSTATDPIIITDNFFFPSAPEEPTTNSYYEYDNAKNDTIDESEDENLEQKPTSETPDVTDSILTTLEDVESTTAVEEEETTQPMHDNEDYLKVIPIRSYQKIESTPTDAGIDLSLTSSAVNQSEIPTVIPLVTDLLPSERKTAATPASTLKVTTSSPSLTTEDIEAGLTDELYLSLSRLDFPQIVPSKVENEGSVILSSSIPQSSQVTPELETSVYYTETVVTSTRLRTYTYVVTKLNGQETEVTSSTSIRPRVTTLTLTVPVTVTVTPTLISSSVALNSSLAHKKNEEVEDEGRKFNLATRVMSNGVEVIVAGTTPAYRWENSNPQPTLTLSEAVLMLMPQDKPNDFVTKTCMTTFTYLNTILRDGTTIVSTDQQVIANTATEERHRKRPAEAASVTLDASPTLQTEVFKTTYTYLTLNSDHPDEKNALGSSTKVITNIVTAPQYYLEMILEPSETPRPETNTYLSTRALEKTYVEEGKTKIEMTTDVVTQLIITESSVPPPRATSLTTPSPVADESISPTTDIAKTYYITYTYFNTYLENDSTVVKTNIATSSDIIYEKAPSKKSSTKSIAVSATPEPIQIFATKTYLTTFTYFTTLLQAGLDGETSTTISSRTKIVENVVTESIAPSLLDAGYMNALLTTSHHSDTLKNVVTGSTIIFFDDEEQVTPTSAAFDTSASAIIDKIDAAENTSTSPIVADSVGAESNDVTTRPLEQDNAYNEEEAAEETTDPPPSKKPSQVSNLLSLGSLGINSLSALGPVITAMAGLLQGKSSATRRNDTESVTELPTTTTQRSPIYIPVGEFADGDIETAESQNIAHHLANSNVLTETRHKVAASLDGGIAISPGEIITANSDVIIGKPGKMAPRPPQTFLNEENIGMKPPPVSVPNIPVHPVLEVVEREPVKPVKIQKGSQQLEIYPSHQIYEEHIQVPITYDQPNFSKRPQNIHENIHIPPVNRISSKKDILENDPLLIPPSVLLNSEKHRHMDKHRRPWSAKDPIPQANVLIDDKNRLGYAPIDIGSGIQKKEYVPEPIVHQVPHVIDRSTGQPLLVNIQPSQVANVVIPQGGTQALIFGDTPEPHKSGQYFDDPSPYPEPEVGPGFIGIDKVENLPQFSKNDNPSDYMTPPSPTLNLKPLQNSNSGNRPHVIPLSTNQDHKKYSQVSARPEKIPIRHHDTSSLSSGGQGHVHTEILVHHGGESGQTRPLSSARPPIPVHNYQNIQHPPRKDYTKIHMAVEQTPPRRTEVPSENSYYDQQLLHANVNWNSNKNEKKPLRPSQVRWARPTSRPSRPPTKITGRPYGRPSTRLERPSGSIRPPQFTQRLPTTTYYQNEQQKFNQQPPTSIPFGESNQQTYMSGPQDKPQHYYQDNYTGINLQITTNHTVQDYKGDSLADQINLGLGYKSPSVDEIESDSKIIEKPMDSDVEASEDIKISTGLNDKPEDDIIITEDSDKNKFETTITFDQDRVDENGDGEIIMGSEKKQDQYLAQSTYGEFNHMNNNHHNVYVTDTGPQQNMTSHTQFIDLQSPVVNPSIEPNGHSRPFLKSHFSMTLSDNKPDIITESPDKNDEIVHGHIKPGLGQVLHVQNDKNEYETRKNDSRTHIYRRPKPDFPSRIHADRPEIITKPKLKTPRPVVVSSGKIRKQNNYRKPQVQFSLPIDSTGEENDSKTQTERPPSSDTTNYHKKPTQESLDTAFQTNFASDDHKDEVVNDRVEADGSFSDTQKISDSKSKLLPQDMVPPPVTPVVNKDILKNDEGLKPPPLPTVLGLTPPPVDITTTTRPIENNPKVNAEVSGLKPPPLYIPLQESSTPLQPSVDMVPPSPRPSLVRPFLADVLSQDMVPPPPDVKTTRPLEIATIRPGVAVSGSIQIDTAVATSHIPVVQDMESKIPIVHGTVDLPVVVDVPEFLKPIDNKKPDHVSVYTVRPFETRQRHTTPPTISPSKTTSVAVTKQTQVKNNERVHEDVYVPTRLSPSDISIKPSKQPELIIDLEPSTDIHMPSSGIEATESLNIAAVNTKRTKQRSSVTEVVTKAPPVVVESSQVSKNTVQQSSSSTQGAQATRKTDLKIKQSASKMMEIIGTVVHEFIQNSTNEQVETQPHEVTRFETLTVTRTETLVLGSPPTTRTLLITHTLTSTRVETVTETLLRPTSVISTIISTILQSATHVPTYENDNTDNESIFVVMSDHTPPAAGAEEVEAEYGEEDVSRDEEDNSVNEIHRVLQGGILEAPSVPIRPPKIQCLPECKGFKSEVCAESATGETRCICRPGFARMFPDRPCKPTYTFTLGVGLERLGRDRFIYDPAMNDTNSIAFRRYAHPIKEALDRTLMQSDLRDAYRAANIVGFTVKPSKVMFNVQLSSNTDETHLKDVLRKYLVLSNYSLGGTDVYASKDLGLIEANDFDECTNEEGGPHHDCSVNAACFNLKGTYQCSCKEGFADLSENPTYPGRLCSQAPLGCAACNNKGHCLISSHGQEVCECFPWYSGQKCQVNLKVLLIGLVTTGAILLGLLAVCVGMACCRNPVRRRGAGDRRAMIAGGGGDTSSEGSVAELALPHHVPHILPPPPQMIAPQPPLKKVAKKVSGKTRRAPRKPAPLIAPVPSNVSCLSGEQRDRSMTVMIPRAKYRATSQQSGPLPPNYKPMSSFAVDEHKLIDYLESGPVSAHRKPSLASEPDYKEQSPIKMQPAQQSSFATSGALVSAGFQVSATVTRAMDAESTLGRSYTETTVEPATKLVRVSDFCDDLESTMVRSCAETTIQASTKQLLRLELADAGSTLARSCGETTIQPPTRLAERNSKDRDLTRDSASEGHTMAERDLGSTLRLPAQRATLYNQDRTTSSDRESNFDSL